MFYSWKFRGFIGVFCGAIFLLFEEDDCYALLCCNECNDEYFIEEEYGNFNLMT
jgi:hypothetical protein